MFYLSMNKRIFRLWFVINDEGYAFWDRFTLNLNPPQVQLLHAKILNVIMMV